MNIHQIKQTIETCFNNNRLRRRALMLIGPSGVGKSQAVMQAATELDVPVIDMRLAQYDPTDVRGVPTVTNDGRTQWCVPSTYPDHATQPKGILFLDEITSAPRDVQAVAYQIVLDRTIGEYTLPDGWMVIAAGNRTSDKGATHTMAAPLISRMTVIDVETDANVFLEHAMDSGVHTAVLAFIKSRPDMLHKFDPTAKSGPFPSPRSWFAVSDLLSVNLPPGVRTEMIIGCVGPEAGMMFESVMRYCDMIPEYESIVRDPMNATMPVDRSDVQYAVALAIIARARIEDANPIVTYLNRMPREVMAYAMSQLAKRVERFERTTAYGQWQMDNRDLAR
jgi:hypothetical protein